MKYFVFNRNYCVCVFFVVVVRTEKGEFDYGFKNDSQSSQTEREKLTELKEIERNKI